MTAVFFFKHPPASLFSFFPFFDEAEAVGDPLHDLSSFFSF
jgi:hypothetical protein